MSWDQPGTKTPEQIKASADAHREEVIKSYRATLDDLEKKIKAADEKLLKLKSDHDEVHIKRLDEYQKQEDILNNQRHAIANEQRMIDTQKVEIQKRATSLEEAMVKENQRVADNTVRLQAKEDQLEATRHELDDYAKTQIEVRDIQAETQKEHIKRKEELDQSTNDLNAAIAKHITDHHELKAAIAAHQVNINAYNEALKDLEFNRTKSRDFFDAVVAREKSLEPLKKKYEDGILVNEQEAQRLKDMNIESYRTKRDAEQRLDLAIKKEQFIIQETEKLQNLKDDLHAQLKKEK